MARTVPEWIGKTDDTKAPERVRTRVFLAKGGRCHRCSRKIASGDAWTLEHVVALINGGGNRESNLDVTCRWCLPAKNAEDVAEKARVYNIRSKHIGAKPPSRNPIPGSRNTPYRKRMDGTVVLRQNQEASR